MRQKQLDELLILAVKLGTAWDFLTSFLGIAGLLGVTRLRGNLNVGALGACITAIVSSFIILCLSIYSEQIWSSEKDRQGNVLRGAHVIAVIYDAYTTFLGTAQNVLLRENSSAFISVGLPEVFGKLRFEAIITLMVATALITACPIVLRRIQK